MDWTTDGGSLINKTSRTLIIAFDSPSGVGWAYMTVSPDRMTLDNTDVDGFRVRESGIKISHKYGGIQKLGWWKIRNGMIATVKEDEKGRVYFTVEVKSNVSLKFKIGAALLDPQPKSNQDFGWTGNNELLAEATQEIS